MFACVCVSVSVQGSPRKENNSACTELDSLCSSGYNKYRIHTKCKASGANERKRSLLVTFSTFCILPQFYLVSCHSICFLFSRVKNRKQTTFLVTKIGNFLPTRCPPIYRKFPQKEKIIVSAISLSLMPLREFLRERTREGDSVSSLICIRITAFE